MKKHSRMGCGRTQVFAYGEDIPALRLTSELVELSAGYVNWCACTHRIKIG